MMRTNIQFSQVVQTTCAHIFDNSSYNYYPDNVTNYGNNQIRLNLAATLETTLGQLHDLRCMVLGEPARGLGFSDTSYQSFVGAPSSMDLSTDGSTAWDQDWLNRNCRYITETISILAIPQRIRIYSVILKCVFALLKP